MVLTRFGFTRRLILLSIATFLTVSTFHITSAQEGYLQGRVYLRRKGGNSDNSSSFDRARQSDRSPMYQRDESPRAMVSHDQVTGEEEEERYVPASFHMEDIEGLNGNGLYNGHAIEMMTPVEVPEYSWNEGSKGLSELDHGVHDLRAPGSDGNPQEFARAGDGGGTAGGGLTQCGDREIDQRHAICCNGLVFRKTEQDSGKCCGSVAYDDRYFTCCQGRAIVRKNGQLPLCCGDYSRDSLPDQCRHGYQSDNTGLGSTCCRSGSGGWQCCLKGESCCASGTAVDVPGFRPACCHLSNEDLTAQCCASTYQKIRILPDCCSSQRLKPVCCQSSLHTTIKCCPGTIGYCCSQDRRTERPTDRPPYPVHIFSTRYPLVPTYAPLPTYAPRPPRPTYGPRPTYAPLPIYSTQYPVRVSSERYPVTPGDRLVHTTAVLPSCCSSKTPLRQCCSQSKKSSSCCQKVRYLPRCCFVVFFNPVCCRTQLQQQQQQQQQLPSALLMNDRANPSSEVDPSFGPSLDRNTQHHQNAPNLLPDSDVQPLNEAEFRLSDESPSSPGTGSRSGSGSSSFNSNLELERPAVGPSCCRLDSSAAVSCCRDGYQEFGRLPACCVATPEEFLEPNDADPGTVHQESNSPDRRQLQNDAPSSSRQNGRRNGGRKDGTSKDGVSKDGGSRDRATKDSVSNTSSSTPTGKTCEGITFNAEDFLCCNNTLRRRIGVSPACCDTAAFDKFLYQCCDGKVRVSCRSDYKPKKSVWGILI